MPISVNDWLEDIQIFNLSLESEGAYFRLLASMWQRGGSLPDEINFICHVLRCKPVKWKKIKLDLLNNVSHFYILDEQIYDDKLLERLLRAQSKSKNASETELKRIASLGKKQAGNIEVFPIESTENNKKNTKKDPFVIHSRSLSDHFSTKNTNEINGSQEKNPLHKEKYKENNKKNKEKEEKIKEQKEKKPSPFSSFDKDLLKEIKEFIKENDFWKKVLNNKSDSVIINAYQSNKPNGLQEQFNEWRDDEKIQKAIPGQHGGRSNSSRGSDEAANNMEKYRSIQGFE